MTTDYQSRKWQLTINNPQKCGYDEDKIYSILNLFNPDYFCFAFEISGTGTLHLHIFIYSKSPMRFSTVQRRFPTAHIEKARGTVKANRDYIGKNGKWAEDKKAETAIKNSFFEFGDIPSEKEEGNPKMYELLQRVKSGETTIQIIDSEPSFAFKCRDINLLRETYHNETFLNKKREILVEYIFGDSIAEITKYIYSKHSPSDVCRVADYSGKNGVRFDVYNGEDVLVMQNYNSQIELSELINYLDGYPIKLPARYYNRVACYTHVYIVSNFPISQQYINEQKYHKNIWDEFINNIDNVIYCSDGKVDEIEI